MTGVAGVGTVSLDDLPLMQQRPFRMLSFTRFTSRIASNAINFSLVLLIVDETGLAFLSSLLVLALIVPSTVIGLVAGVVADALPKRPIIFLANLARAGVCAAIVYTGETVALYFFAAVAFSAAGQFASSAEGAVLPTIVTRERLARANAIGHAITGAAQIVGFVVIPPIALRIFDSPAMLFFICGILFVIAAFQALLIGRIARPASVEIAPRSQSAWWAAGWHEIRRDPAVTRATIELTLISSSMILLGGLIPTYIQDTLRLPVEIGAVVLLPAAIGVVVGLRLAGYLATRVPHGLLSSVGFVGFVACLLIITFARPLSQFLEGYGAFSWLVGIRIGSFDGTGVLTMLVVIPAGFGYALVSVAAQTVINERVPLHLQGRVNATQGALAALGSSIPVLIAGAMTDVVGVTTVMAVLAISIGFAAFANLRGGPRRALPGFVGARRSH